MSKEKRQRIRSTSWEWSCEKTLKLIDLVKERPLLWDSSLDQYRDRARRDEAWEDIANILGYPKLEITCKWALLRQQFRNGHRRLLKTGKKGRAPSEFYTKMTFLERVFLNDKTEASDESFLCDYVQQSAPFKSLDYGFESNDDINYNDNEETIFSLDDPLTIFTTSSIESSPKSQPRDYYSDSSVAEKQLSVLSPKEEGELNLWGRYLVTTLKNYPDKVAIRKFKAAVSLNLAKLENGEFDV